MTLFNSSNNPTDHFSIEKLDSVEDAKKIVSDMEEYQKKWVNTASDSESESNNNESEQELANEECFDVEIAYGNNRLKRLAKFCLRNQQCDRSFKQFVNKVEQGRHPLMFANGIRLNSKSPEFSNKNFIYSKNGNARILMEEKEKGGYTVVALSSIRKEDKAELKKAVYDHYKIKLKYKD